MTRSASSAASSSSSSRCSGAKALARSIASLEVGDLDQRQRRVGDARARSAAAARSRPRPRRARAPRRRRRPAGCRRRARPGRRGRAPPTRDRCRGRRPPSAPRARRSESIPTVPETGRLASRTQALPGPAITSTGGDRLGAVGEREDRLGAAHRVDLVDPAERGGGEHQRVQLARRGRAARRARPARPRRPGPGSRTSGRSTG